ncbi:baseplate J/gp47 family protein [Asaia bogorensis]|uniref:baseplate J/gp47 family protein n=1 Tax=Asaia bogorensis TaxID=91915 RepID=UPI003019E767
MTLPIPSPATLAQRFVAGLAQQSFTASDGTRVTLDATAPQTLEQALSILLALADYETYLYVRDIGIELMVSTATVDGLLPQHAQIWGVPREGATAAVGNFIVQSSSDSQVILPVGTLFTVDGSAQWAVTVATTIASNAAASVAVQAVATGESGNLPANTSAQLVSPIPGIQSITSDQTGIIGGAPIESAASWRDRIIDVIRNPPGVGTRNDYVRWAKLGGAALVNVVPGWAGVGTVGVICAMAGGVPPTSNQLATIAAAVDARRPVRGNVFVLGAIAVAQNLTIALNPDTPLLRSAITAALPAYLLSVGVGGTLYREGYQAIITSLNGYSNDLIAPAEDISLAPNQIGVLGTIDWIGQSQSGSPTA